MSFLGDIAYKFFFKPIVQPLAKLKNDGGPYGRYLIRKGEAEMKDAANSLTFECSKKENTSYPWVHFLTGKSHWYQTAFCAYSLVKYLDLPVHLVFHDDGSLDEAFIKKIKSQVANCSVDTLPNSTQRLNQLLPEEEYPFLRKARLYHPMFYKLFDTRIGYPGYHLMLDSDMLFYKRPEELKNWFLDPDKNFYMQDKFNSYIYSPALINNILENPIINYVNAGVTGLNNDLIDWREVEQWAKRIIEAEGLNFFFEQTTYALLFTKHGAKALNPEEYIIIPSKDDINEDKGCLHHYPSGFRQYYLSSGWRKII